MTHANYRGRRISLLTQHGKEQVMAPLFRSSLDVQLELATGFDTDTLGTFTRTLARHGSQLDAARAKAKKGMELLGLDCGVASEGALIAGPLGLLPTTFELVIFIDEAAQLEIVGGAEGPARHVHGMAETFDEVLSLARAGGFPDHAMVLRPESEIDPRVQLGIRDEAALLRAFERARGETSLRRVFLESDLRAHLNPTRMSVIVRATRNLISREFTAGAPSAVRQGIGQSNELQDCAAVNATHRPLRRGLSAGHVSEGTSQKHEASMVLPWRTPLGVITATPEWLTDWLGSAAMPPQRLRSEGHSARRPGDRQ